MPDDFSVLAARRERVSRVGLELFAGGREKVNSLFAQRDLALLLLRECTREEER